MKKTFVSLQQLQKIAETYPTPYHLYDERESGKTRAG